MPVTCSAYRKHLINLVQKNDCQAKRNNERPYEKEHPQDEVAELSAGARVEPELFCTDCKVAANFKCTPKRTDQRYQAVDDSFVAQSSGQKQKSNGERYLLPHVSGGALRVDAASTFDGAAFGKSARKRSEKNMNQLAEAFKPQIHPEGSPCRYSCWDPVVRGFVNSLLAMCKPEEVTYSPDIPIAQQLDGLDAKIDQLAQHKLFSLFKSDIDAYLAKSEQEQEAFFEDYPEINHECATCKDNLFCLCTALSIIAMGLHEYAQTVAMKIPDSSFLQLLQGPLESLKPDQLRARTAMERLRTIAKGSASIPRKIEELYLLGNLALIQ
jgi:hypothetical protein